MKPHIASSQPYSRPAAPWGAGFTLIEVLVVAALIAILAAVAVPSYQSQVAQARRSTMQAELVRLAQSMERIYSETGCYNPGSDNDCNTAADASNPPIATKLEHYSVDFPVAVDAERFRIRATPTVGPQATDGFLEINHLGQQFWDKNDDGDVDDAGESDWNRR